ncbi:LacI family DNA-binding transcriptional regulator [Streptomyces sp. NPDC090445]|uniref:LacI family DNA-binding transcriptional regulator n=1 Tax=Streptomyces sp. NPDC090445 TaxID=3365963 RepID=UPI0037FBC292
MVSGSRREGASDRDHPDSGAVTPSGAGSASTPRRPTSHDVARLAGVSQASVSLVFSGKGSKRISAATEKRVRDAGERLGYRPQAAARQLRMGRTGLVLLAVPNIRGPLFAQVLAGAHDAAEAHGLTVVASSSWNSRTLTRVLSANQFDGLVICSPNDRQIDELPPFVPTVLIDSDPALSGQNRPVVDLDVAGGMRTAVGHLVDLGHHSIGHLRYQRASYSFRSRQAGFEVATRDLRVTELSIPLEETLDPALEAALKLLSDRTPPRAVVCDDDVAATAVYRAAAALGMRVPDDVSVVGIDNANIAGLLLPGLTTVDLHGEELGNLGVDTMAAMLREETVEPLKQVRTDLVIRKSTCPAR